MPYDDFETGFTQFDDCEFNYDDGKDDFNRFEEREIDNDNRLEFEEYEELTSWETYDGCERELFESFQDISDDNWACGTLDVD